MKHLAKGSAALLVAALAAGCATQQPAPQPAPMAQPVQSCNGKNCNSCKNVAHCKCAPVRQRCE